MERTKRNLRPLGFMGLGLMIGFCVAQLFFWSPPVDLIKLTNLARYVPKNFNRMDDSLGGTTKVYTIDEVNEKESRILCWVMTAPTNHETKAKYIKETWGKRCNILLFMSSAEDKKLGSIALPVGEGRDNLWMKTKEAHKYIYSKHLNDADWFFKADDDTYTIVENLRLMLKSYSPKSPIYFGYKYNKFVKQGYMSGGSGYVLSREAVKRLVENGLSSNETCQKFKYSEDVWIGNCLDEVQVLAGDSRDEQGRERFSALHLDRLFYPKEAEQWFQNNAFYPLKGGKNCCSDHLISVHYIDPKDMAVYDYLIYNVKVGTN